jgi:MFS family permease
MIVLDISIVITALPQMQDTLGLSTAGLSWVQNAYTLAFGGLLLLGARAGGILGHRMFVAGLTLFTAASLAVGAAPGAAWLITARAVQGVGAAVLAPSTLALLTVSFPEGRERTRAVAYYGAVAGIGASLGLLIGGILTDLISWRVGFFINLPIGAGMITRRSGMRNRGSAVSAAVASRVFTPTPTTNATTVSIHRLWVPSASAESTRRLATVTVANAVASDATSRMPSPSRTNRSISRRATSAPGYSGSPQTLRMDERMASAQNHPVTGRPSNAITPMVPREVRRACTSRVGRFSAR